MLLAATGTGLALPFMERMIVKAELVVHDGPLCVLLADPAGRLYLAHFVTYRDADEYWYVVPVEPTRFERLRYGQMSLGFALRDVDSTMRLVGRLVHRSESEYRFAEFRCVLDLAEIDEQLPDDSFRFFDGELGALDAGGFQPVGEYARVRHAEVIYLDLLGPASAPGKLPVTRLGEIGSSVQRAISDLASYEADEHGFGRRGPRQLAVETASQFALTGIGEGSVRLRLEAISEPTLFPEMEAAFRGVRAFVGLCEIQDVGGICEALRAYPGRIRSAFLSYFSNLNRGGCGVGVEWGSPRLPEPRCTRWDRGTVAALYEKVSGMQVSEEATFEAAGVFTQGNMGTGFFKFLDTGTGRTIPGRLGPDVDRVVVTLARGAEAGGMYRVDVREAVRTSETGTQAVEYTFLSVEEIERGARGEGGTGR